MITKELKIDAKNTIWHRTHIEISAETEQELQEKINNFDFKDYSGIESEYLYDTVENLPLNENQYNPTVILIDNYNPKDLKDNLQDIEKEDVKMFSINDIKDIWYQCYGENFKGDYKIFYDTILMTI